MIFNFLNVKTLHKKIWAEIEVEPGQSICGLQQSGQRPHSVTLSYDDFVYLLKNVEYTVSQVLPALSGSIK